MYHVCLVDNELPTVNKNIDVTGNMDTLRLYRICSKYS